MATVVLFNKPFDVLTQFRPDGDRVTLAQFIDNPSLRVAGRLDRDSEGLLLLTDDGKLNALLTDPKYDKEKTYLAQVEGIPTDEAMQRLCQGVMLNDGMTKPAQARIVEEPDFLWPRTPPVRFRAQIPTTWIELTIREGRNRQVRRMTAAVGYPTLRLIRIAIGEYQLGDLAQGQCREIQVSSESLVESGSTARRAPRSGRERTASAARDTNDGRSRQKRRSNLPIGFRGKRSTNTI
jgi:23S rRNA pseudouridine2457 synthase